MLWCVTLTFICLLEKYVFCLQAIILADFLEKDGITEE